jgi:predicted GH43/DUF377 family glycosyl hydrolase
VHDLHTYGLATYVLKRGGSVVPITLPPELTGETGVMNPSIFVHKGRILMNIRHVNYTLYHSEGKKFVHQWGPLVYVHPENDVTLTTHNIMCELDEDMNIISSGRINMKLDTGKPTWNFIGLEDGRLFSWDDRLFLCGVRRDCYDDKGTGRMELCEIEQIDGEWTEVGRFPIPAPGKNDSFCEKNWMPIVDMPWHFVKWTNPTEVARFDIKTGTTVTAVLDESKIYNFPRDIRGGTQVVRINEQQRLAITHEVDLFRDIHGRKDGHYMHRAVIWDNDWNIQHSTREFTFMGCRHDVTYDLKYGIEFATGLAFINGFVLISYGFQDNACFVMKIPEKVFLEFLSKG